CFFFLSRRLHTSPVSAFLLNRSSDLKHIWTAPLPPETELSRQMTTTTTSIDIMGLQAAYVNLHTDQERDYFMQRYHDVISSFGGKTSYDADNRPDRKSGSAGMPRPISYAVFCLEYKREIISRIQLDE